MHIKISLTEDVINKCLSLHYGRQTGSNKLKQRLIFIPAVLIIISCYLIYTEYQKTSPGPNLYLAVLYIAFAVGYYFFMKNRLLQAGKRLLKGMGENAEFEMEVDEEKLVTKTKTGTITTEWSQFIKAIVSKDNVLLYQQDNSFTMFNQSFFHPGDFVVFKTWTREKVSPVIEAPAV
jgi:hypothetical protein